MIIHKRIPVIEEVISFNRVIHIEETINLNGAGLMTGIPVNPDRESCKKSIEFISGQSFGLFGGSSNQNNFYPDINLADVIPKPEDFVDIDFRFISATTVGGYSWKATDFGEPGVLKASVKLLANKSMFTDHEQAADNWIGYVADPYWTEVTMQDKIKVPAGIDGKARLDYKTNPSVVRGVLMGGIYSNSVTVATKWSPSHMFDDMTEFYNKIGEIAEDGKMVRRITQEVKDYFESSLLWLGADPFSKRKNPDGTYHNIDKSMIVSYSKANNGDKLSAEDQKKYIIDMAIDESIISLSQSNITKQIKERSKTQDKMFNKFILAFMAAYGTKLGLSFTYKEGDTLTDVQQEEMVTALAKLDLKNDTPPDPILAFAKGLTTRKEDGSFTAFVPEANAVAANFVVLPKVEAERVYGELKKVPTEEQITFLNKRAELGDSYLKLKRDETKRMYKVAMGTKADDAILNSIDGMEGSVLEAFMKQYAGDALLKFGPTCTKCGDDKHIEMRSSIQTGTKEDEVTSLGEVPSIASVARQMDRRGFGLGGN